MITDGGLQVAMPQQGSAPPWTIFEELGTALVYNRPEDPNAFLIEELKKKQAKKVQHFFSKTDVKTMFSMFDTTNKGYITKEQYAQGAWRASRGNERRREARRTVVRA